MRRIRHQLTIAAIAGALALGGAPGSVEAAPCKNGREFCPDGGTPGGGGATKRPCWNKEFKRDDCNKPPPPCPPNEAKGTFKFIDDGDGKNDGQLIALGTRKPFVACGTLTVTKTGYYKIFDTELSESCASQKDETGYVTITNSCNAKGYAVQANVGSRYLVLDSDNTPKCSSNSQCKSGRVCRTGNTGANCCVPATPTFMGTFLLVAGEKNRICLRHWCPEWRTEKSATGKDPGFVTASCKTIDSIHFRLDAKAIACLEDTTLKPCTFGCKAGKCQPDPCKALKCPTGFCKDGKCLKENPCLKLTCSHGCVNGRCLQPPSTPGIDADKDGYPYAADCDDDNAAVHPGATEVCNNKLDDDCDGVVDEVACSNPNAPGTPGGAAVPGVADGGCDCDVTTPPSPTTLGLAFVLGLLVLVRRRRDGR